MDRTLCFLLRGDDVLLGFKKRGLGAGKLVGVGGKVEPGEDLRAAAVREVHEEIRVRVDPADLEPAGRMHFVFPARPEWEQRVHVFLARSWTGDPVETDELRPEWFSTFSLPTERMWEDNRLWLPDALAGLVRAYRITFGPDNEAVTEVAYEA